MKREIEVCPHQRMFDGICNLAGKLLLTCEEAKDTEYCENYGDEDPDYD